MPSRKFTATNKNLSDELLSPETLEIVIDDEFESDLFDEDSNSQSKYRKPGRTDDEHNINRPWKKITVKNSKSHRLIEKRRRDRMNRSLDVLLNLIPHKKPKNQRRIEKTEIIEMAIKYIRCLLSSNSKSCKPFEIEKKINSKVDIYRTGYYNGIGDMYEYIEKQSNDKQLHAEIFQYIQQKEVELKDLMGEIPISDKKNELKPPKTYCDKLNDNRFSLCERTKIQDDENNSIKQAKVPTFVLHPSGTHYIPMHIDSSIVINEFNNYANRSQTCFANEQPQCHPVSIPVNFNFMSVLSNQHELDIQNINVIGATHLTGVKTS
ncbi:unnamed protein product [Rotaria magnacalcarata]|uniref:BHLH domain-containing protein n=1 Tax=Rotaria magnacalcarata TaxID=392030 RepID=A0A819CT64_9BILA|nr:unnamed protein product [Rotaria magnacalcarata]CAF3989232.1 unnamed protein product [Rotaria magnacalcarata]